MTRLAAAFVRAVASAAVLAALLGALPVLLVRVGGWPLPRHLPEWAAVRDGLAGGAVPDEVIVKALALTGWGAWGLVAASALAEAWAWARGRAPGRVPLSGPVQVVVRRLLLSALLAGLPLRSPAKPARPIPATLAVAEPAPNPCGAAGVPGDVRTAPPPTPADVWPTYVVRPRDSLWALAERHLGDGLRWRELWELNRGRPQPDGRALRDPDLIRPGWVLRFPPDAVGLSSAPARGEPAPARSALDGTPPESTSHPAPASSPAPTPGLTPEPAAQTPTHAPGPDPTPPRADSARGSGRGPGPDPPSAPAEAHTGSGEDEPGDAGEPALPARLGLGLLAAGLVGAIGLLRRAAARKRQRPRPADATAARAEAVLRASADPEGTARLELALRVLGACMARAPGEVPPVEAVRFGTDVEVLFAGPLVAGPGPFAVSAGGRAWTLPAALEPADLARWGGGAHPFPALAPVGSLEGAELLVDLEDPALTAVLGDAEEVAALVWALAAGLATAPWAGEVRVLMAGAPPGLAALERVEALDAAGLEALRNELAATRSELAATGAADLRAARLRGGSWAPVVALAGPGTAPGLAAALRALAGPGLAVVAAGEPDGAARTITVAGGRVRIDPPGLVAEALPLPEWLRSGADEALAAASGSAGPPAAADLREPPCGPTGEPPRPLGADGTVLVRVLGPVAVEGGARPLDRRRAEELVVYLALHPQGADEQRLKTALWPEAAPSGHAFNQLVSRARVCLGAAPDGTHHLPRLEGTRYRLGSWVRTDVGAIATAAEAARGGLDEASAARLTEALALVRGQPFEGARAGYAWAHSEGLASHMEILVAEAAHALAGWHLERGEAGPALWAAEQGLRAAPWDEALWRDRMAAHAAAGNTGAVEAVWRELCAVAEAHEPYDTLHPETVELYERLTRRRVG